MPAKRRTPEPRRRNPTHTWDLLIIGTVALLVRVAHSVAIWRGPIEDNLYLNPARYDAWARMILDGVGPSAPWEQAPGYPYLVSLLYAFSAADPRAVIGFQALLSAATCVAIALIAREFAGRWAAVASGSIAALYGPFVYFQAELLPETVLVFLLTAAVAAVVGSRGSWTTAGILWGLAYLVRTNVVIGIPLAIGHAWYSGGRRAAAALALPCVLAAGGLLAVNLAGGAGDVWSTTSGGVNLWLGNNPTADGVSPFFGPDETPVDDAVRAEARSAMDADRIFSRRARAYWAGHPGEALALAAKKLLWTFTARELPNNADIEWRRSRSPVFRVAGFPLGFGVVFVLALATIAAGKMPRDRRLLAILLPAMIAVGTCIVFFTNARFRLPLAIASITVAGVGVAALRQNLEARRWPLPGIVRAVAGAILAAAITWGNWFGVRDYRIAQIDVNTGASARAAGDFATAIHYLRLAVAREPRDAIGWIHLALALEQSGDVSGAASAYASAEEHLPGDPDVAEMLARFHVRHPLRAPDP